jgi:hypothetical protein
MTASEFRAQQALDELHRQYPWVAAYNEERRRQLSDLTTQAGQAALISQAAQRLPLLRTFAKLSPEQQQDCLVLLARLEVPAVTDDERAARKLTQRVLRGLLFGKSPNDERPPNPVASHVA